MASKYDTLKTAETLMGKPYLLILTNVSGLQKYFICYGRKTWRDSKSRLSIRPQEGFKLLRNRRQPENPRSSRDSGAAANGVQETSERHLVILLATMKYHAEVGNPLQGSRKENSCTL